MKLNRQNGFPDRNNPAFVFDHCGNVELQNNNFGHSEVNKTIQIKNMKKKELKYAPKKAFILNYSKHDDG